MDFKYTIGSKEWKMYAGQNRGKSNGFFDMYQNLYERSGFAPNSDLTGYKINFGYGDARLGKGIYDKKSDDLKTSNFPLLIGAILLYNLIGV